VPRYIYDKGYSGVIDRDNTSIGLVPFQSSAVPSRPPQRTPPPTRSLGTKIIVTEEIRRRRNAVDLYNTHQQANSDHQDSSVDAPSPQPRRNESPSFTQCYVGENGRITVNYDALFELTSLLTFHHATAESVQPARGELERQIESRRVAWTAEELEVAEKESKRKRLKEKCAKLWAKVKLPETWGPD
jgi:hypothetical protein